MRLRNYFSKKKFFLILVQFFQGDLIKTEQRFSDWFSSIDTWQGIASRIPRRTEWISYISDYDVFM